jgi:hypothetical protein
LTGVGENCFYLNESMGDQGILDFETWYNYDFHDHGYQESFSGRKSDAIKPYRGRIHGRWTRMLIDNNFYYATLITEAGFLYSALDEVADDYINELIPYDFVEGKNHGKKVNGGSLWDMRRNAKGLRRNLRS